MRAVRATLGALAAGILLSGGAWTEELPRVPVGWFNDYAGLVPPAEARRLDQKLRRLDEETSTQVVVAVFPKLPSPSLEDFTARTAQSWRVGRGELDNGAIFFVFVEDGRMRIEVGYGLEGALPDALAGRILREKVAPRFQQKDWTGGLEAGIDAIVAAVQGEYAAPAPERPAGPSLAAVLIVVALVILFLLLVRFGTPGHPGRTYGGRGSWRDSSHWGGGRWGGGSSWGGGGRSWGGGGGGFMGGGGSFGGGGASGSW